ncbi:MAG: acetylxylan esterase [Propionicimonas sp.]
MPSIDLSLTELESYRASEAAPSDFDEAWARTLAEARQVPMVPRVEPVATGLQLVRSYDVSFPGFAGDPIRAWLTVPATASGRLPVVVTYNGYGGGRGLPIEHITWATAGYAELFMDTRGQGSSWGNGGGTPDPHDAGAAGPGYLTRGIESFDGYYYRRLVTDAVRAVDAARTLPQVDPDRVVVTGISQGGGLAIAVAGLADRLVAAMPDVPFLCHFSRAIALADSDPYQEVARYLAVHRSDPARVFTTLAYIDGIHHAARASAPALFSVGLLDHTCPPSTVYAAYHAWRGPRQIEVYPFNDHEGGQAHQVVRQLAWLREVVGLEP